MTCADYDWYEWHEHRRGEEGPPPPRSWLHGDIALAPELPQNLSVSEEFDEHARKWVTETAYISSITVATNHPSYEKIVAMGLPIVPFILRELQLRPNHWFSALRRITGENPVTQEDTGNIRKMVDAWLRWGKKRNLLP